MLGLTEPQVWVLMSIFAVAIFGMIEIVMARFHRTLTASINSLREVMEARLEVQTIPGTSSAAELGLRCIVKRAPPAVMPECDPISLAPLCVSWTVASVINQAEPVLSL